MSDQREAVADLLPCPFCGGKAVTTKWFSVISERPDWWVASCVFGCGRSSEETTQENAIKAWNRRALLSPYSSDREGVRPEPAVRGDGARSPSSLDPQWVLVPREPTEDMLDNAHDSYGDFCGAHGIWSAMISAIPTPPPETEGGGWRPWPDGAPKDGTAFLTFGDTRPGYSQVRQKARWDLNAVYCAECGHFTPTHWMPLPESPR